MFAMDDAIPQKADVTPPAATVSFKRGVKPSEVQP
jgi:hypothetical protein